MKHDISKFKLGLLHTIQTDNPESSRKLIARQVEELCLRWLYRIEGNNLLIVLWNDKILKGAK